jgi:hypothetical protein
VQREGPAAWRCGNAGTAVDTEDGTLSLKRRVPAEAPSTRSPARSAIGAVVLFDCGDLCDGFAMVNRPNQGTTQPGFTNRNAQQVIRNTGLLGTDHLQTVYVLECGQCQHRYAANGSEIFERRCPKCQSGKPSIHIAANEVLKD